jgi:hypothetical protein
MFNPGSVGKGREMSMFSDSNSPNVAKEIFVPQNTRSFSGRAGGVAQVNRSLNSEQGATAASMSREVSVGGMEGERQSLLQEGFSEEVLDTMQASVKKSSSRLYDRLWKIYVHWCAERDVNPRTASLTSILALLQSLLKKGLAYRTIGVYRSAISKFHDPIEGFTVGKHPKVSKFMKNPPTRSLLPTWDVNVDLKFLEAEPFEPLQRASLHALTFKTVFLVALTSVRRCSELQALGRNAPYIRFENGAVRLRTVLGFLPKTATPSCLGEDIVLPVNKFNKKLCVVTCLNRYLKVTDALMSQMRAQSRFCMLWAQK